MCPFFVLGSSIQCSQVIHCLKLTSSILCLCFSKSTVSKPDENWTFSLLKSLSRLQISKGLWGSESCGNTGWWRKEENWVSPSSLSVLAHGASLILRNPILSASWDPKEKEGEGSACVLQSVLSLCDCTALWLPLVWIPNLRSFWMHPDCPSWVYLQCLH